MKILVAGGSGLLGHALVSTLRHDGHQVAVLTRKATHPDDVLWSLDREPGGWTTAVESADAVINLAGAPIAAGRWTTARKAEIVASRTRSTALLVAAIRHATRPPRLINASAIGFYGSRGDEPLTETSAPGHDFLARLCIEWEAEASKASDVARVVLLRTGVVLARDGGALPQLALPFRLFAGGPIGSGKQYISWIHLDDWVALVRWALTTPVAGPLNATAPNAVTNAEFARALGQALHRPAIVPAPAFALRLALGEMADAMILGGQRVLPAKAESLGFRFSYPALGPALASIYRRE
jgi:uncharacterized protein (TIGR01777 family)